jgi:DNA topoisomerase-2
MSENTGLESYKVEELENHIYNTPDTYVGGVDEIEESLSIKQEDKIINKTIKYIPAVINIWNEIAVNAKDQIERLNTDLNKGVKNIIPVSEIKFTFDDSTQMWTISNNGNGIDVANHPTEKDENGNPMNIVMIIFSVLLSSKNYNKDEEKIVGGKNGYGAKLTNIFSDYFKVETVDHTRGLKYEQEFKNNKKDVGEPIITKTKCKPYTKISWITDFKRFGIKKYSDDMIRLMIRRIYDISGITGDKVNIYYNDKKIKCNTFDKYIDLYLDEDIKVYEKIHDRWDVGISVSKTDKYEHYSFVNGIATFKGGKHVDYITKQITSKLSEYINKKYKKEVPENYIKNYLRVFINSVIVNPSFDSQTKERLITPQSKFGSKPVISDKFIENIATELDLIPKVLLFAEFKQTKEAKKNDGSKVKRINVPKLDDANNAGTRKSKNCTLILTEGDSAKTMAISGLSKIGRDNYGVFPLRGKILNVKGLNIKQILQNEEIKNIIKILGLEIGKDYTKIDSLRYGRIMIMTDQDQDGSHIKGLILNIFHTLWPSLLKLNYITSMITPIVKITKGKKQTSFYNLYDYEEWKNKTKDYKKWSVKYYKGLGTSTSKEAVEYFSNMVVNRYAWSEITDENINLAFNKDLADKRKDWLLNYKPEEQLIYNDDDINIDDFINKELIHFSNSDTLRSIGSVCDGHKPSQRKVMWSCFKRKLSSEIRVAQLAGYVSEHSAYHHGEASLQSTIVAMAQQYIGSNNINLLEPNGQFGSRIMGGADSASPRYIHTQLNKLTNIIYPLNDFPLLEYNNDDGVLIEPKYYVPIIPMVLVNGMIGIGTGFSSNIPQYNPLDIITNIKNKINGDEMNNLIPWYRGFTGKIIKLNDKKFITKGIYKIISNNSIIITELPIGKWTHNYKEFLDSLIDNQKTDKFSIKSYENNSTDTTVYFKIIVNNHIKLKNIKYNKKKEIDTIEELFKLYTTKNTSLTNIHLYNSKNIIQKYNDVFEIINEFYQVRLKLYEDRKEYELSELKQQLLLENTKIRFINDVINEEIVVYRKKKEIINTDLEKAKYPFYIDGKIVEFNEKKIKKKDIEKYNYLIKIPLYNFTEEKIDELQEKISKLTEQYNILDKKTISELWLDELNILEKECKKL